jgi:hypothetical protein
MALLLDEEAKLSDIRNAIRNIDRRAAKGMNSFNRLRLDVVFNPSSTDTGPVEEVVPLTPQSRRLRRSSVTAT